RPLAALSSNPDALQRTAGDRVESQALAISWRIPRPACGASEAEHVLRFGRFGAPADARRTILKSA
ncbi:MAG TPA: hypothetical protein VGL62_10890, partial [Vicinamibacterales bacterium]